MVKIMTIAILSRMLTQQPGNYRHQWRKGATAWLLCLNLAFLPGYADFVVTDDSGREVSLKQPAQRIVSTAPHVTEMLFAIGAGELIVGAAEFSNYPEAAKNIPRIGSHSKLNLEKIIELQPDLVIAWQTGNPESDLNKLADLEFPVFVSEPRNLEDIPSNLKRLGTLTGSTGTAEESANEFMALTQSIIEANKNKKNVRVFYQVWEQPLMTLNGEHLVSKVIQHCGGENIFSSLNLIAPQISIESILQENPDVIIAGDIPGAEDEWKQYWKRWPQLQAVAKDQLYSIPADLIVQHTPRLVKGMEMMCAILDQARIAQSE